MSFAAHHRNSSADVELFCHFQGGSRSRNSGTTVGVTDTCGFVKCETRRNLSFFAAQIPRWHMFRLRCRSTTRSARPHIRETAETHLQAAYPGVELFRRSEKERASYSETESWRTKASPAGSSWEVTECAANVEVHVGRFDPTAEGALVMRRPSRDHAAKYNKS